jgi:hypothetical protein
MKNLTRILIPVTGLWLAVPAAADPAAVATEKLSSVEAKTAPAAPAAADDNFGAIVRKAAEEYRNGTLDLQGYKNFGQWVAAQRRHRHGPGGNHGGGNRPETPPSAGGGGSGGSHGPGTGTGGGGGGHSGGGGAEEPVL